MPVEDQCCPVCGMCQSKWFYDRGEAVPQDANKGVDWRCACSEGIAWCCACSEGLAWCYAFSEGLCMALCML